MDAKQKAGSSVQEVVIFLRRQKMSSVEGVYYTNYKTPLKSQQSSVDIRCNKWNLSSTDRKTIVHHVFNNIKY